MILASYIIVVARLPQASSVARDRLDTHLVRAIVFLFFTLLTFDRLTDLPCAASSPPSTSSARISIPIGGELHNMTAVTGSRSPPPTTTSAVQRGPPVFGAAFYLVRSLAPHCVRIDAVPGQVDSVAWVNVSGNKTSQRMVLGACAVTMVVSVVYLLLALLDRSEVQGVREEPAPPSVRSVGRGSAHSDRAAKGNHSTVSHRMINVYDQEHPADLYHENAVALSNHPPHDTRPDGRRAASLISLRSHLPIIANLGPAVHRAASTPDVRVAKLDLSPVPTRAASDIAPRTPTRTIPPQHPSRAQHFGYGCDHTVDLTSGCIAHQPLFRKRPPAMLFPTLTPPDFSRRVGGLTPRRSKSRAAVSAKGTARGERAEEEGLRGREGAEPHGVAVDGAVESRARGTVEVSSEEVRGVDGVDANAVSRSNDTCTPISTSRTGASVEANNGGMASETTGCKPSRPTVYASAQRLDSVDHLCSAQNGPLPQQPSSQPDTATSTRPSSLMQRRRGPSAVLDLHLNPAIGGTNLPASAREDDAWSYDSHCGSAGTFGDGAGITSPCFVASP